MYAVSSGYRNVIYSGDARHKLKVFFGATELQNADNYCEKLTVKPRIIPNSAKSFALNNFVSKEAELILHNIDLEDVVEPITISIGTLVENAYEYVPIGIFNISDKPTTDKDKTTIKLYDNAIKFDFNYNGKDLIEEKQAGGLEGATRLEVLLDICEQAGVTTQISSFLGSSEIVATWDNTITARTYISFLAEQSGAIATIDRSGELIFIYINDLVTERIPLSIVEKYSLGKPYTIGRVIYEDGTRKFAKPLDDVPYTGDILFISASNPYIKNQAHIDSIYDLVSAFTIDSLKTGKIIGNPAIDPYDLIEIYNNGSLEQETIATTLATYTMVYNGVIINTYDTQIGEQDRKENMSLKNVDNTEELKRYVRSSIDEVNATITLQAGEIDSLKQRTTSVETGIEGISGQITDIQEDQADLRNEFEVTAEGLSIALTKSGNNIIMGTELYDDSQWGWGEYGALYEGATPPEHGIYWYWYDTANDIVYYDNQTGWIETDLKRKDVDEQYRYNRMTIIENEFTANNFMTKRAMQFDGINGYTTVRPTIIDNSKDFLTISFKMQNNLIDGKFRVQFFEQNYNQLTNENYGCYLLVYTKDFAPGEYADLQEYKFTVPIMKQKDLVYCTEGVQEPANPQEGDFWLKADLSDYGLKVYKNGEWVNDRTEDNKPVRVLYATNVDPQGEWSNYYHPDYNDPPRFTEDGFVYGTVSNSYQYQDANARAIFMTLDVMTDQISIDPALIGNVIVGDVKIEYGKTATEWSSNINEVYGKNYKLDDKGFEIKSGNYKMYIDEDEVTGYYQNQRVFQLNKYVTFSQKGQFVETDQDGLITKKLSNNIYVRYIE